MGIVELIGIGELYQWNKWRKLEIKDSKVAFVDYANEGDLVATRVEVKSEEGVLIADIPNNKLWNEGRLRMWFVDAERNAFESDTLTVIQKAKDPDYVYEETEVLSYEDLRKRVEELEKGGVGGGITKETDPTVPDWAKQPEKPTYTAEEVGAASKEEVSKLSEDKADKSNTYTKKEVDAKIQNVPSGEGGSVASEYPKKVFEHEWKDNYDKIDVTAIDYENGILTVSSMPSQITDNTSTTVRVFAEIKVEGITVPFKYGMMPKEIMETATLYYAKKVGENQIVLCDPTTSAELTTITSSDAVNLTRWNLFVEKSRNKAINSVTVKNLEMNHKYRCFYYLPHSSHYCSGITVLDLNGQKFGNGYSGGYPSKTGKLQELNGSYLAMDVNLYETVSLRGKFSNYGESPLVKHPRFLETDIYGLNNEAFIVDSKMGYFAPFRTPVDGTIFCFTDARNSVYLQRPVGSIQFSGGNGNYILDGARCEVWDYGEVF